MAVNSQPKVFISRTGELSRFAELAVKAATAAGFVPVEQSDMQPSGVEPLEYCRRLVGECDVYLGIIGFYFGTPAEGSDPPRSITQAEYDAARDLGKTIMIYPVSDQFEGAPGWIFNDPIPEHRELQLRFREEVLGKNVTAAAFLDFEEFEDSVKTALLHWRIESQERADVESERVPSKLDSKSVSPALVGPLIGESSVLFETSAGISIAECGAGEIRIRRFPSGITSPAMRFSGPLRQLAASQDGVVLVARGADEITVLINLGQIELVPWEHTFPIDADATIVSVRRQMRTVDVFLRMDDRIDRLTVDRSGRSRREQSFLGAASDCAVDGESFASVNAAGQLSATGLLSSGFSPTIEWLSVDGCSRDGIRLLAASGRDGDRGVLLVLRSENGITEIRTTTWDRPLGCVFVPRPDFPLSGCFQVVVNTETQSLVWRWQDLGPTPSKEE